MDGDGEMDMLIGLETARTRAWLERDPALLETLLDEDFVEINYFGRLSKRELIDGLFPRLTLVRLDAADYRLMTISADVACLTYACAETIRIDGNEISGAFTVASTWRRRDAGWRLVLWQITPAGG